MITIPASVLEKFSGLTGAAVGVDKDYITNEMNTAITDKLKADAAGFGREVVKGSGGATPGLDGAIGRAVSKEMPNSPTVNTLPRILMGFQQGGFSGGMEQLGSAASTGLGQLGGMFGKQGEYDPNHGLPAHVAAQIGDAFQGSNAARDAARVLGPVANKAVDSLIDKSMFGPGLKMLANPMGYMTDKAKEFGITSQPFNQGAGTGGASSAS